MNIFKNIDFWMWVFSFDKDSFSKNIFESFKKKCQYKGEYLEINFPITNNFSFSMLSNCEFYEEYLYLKVDEAYYILGWLDCHNHEDVFMFDEFYSIMKLIEHKQTDIFYQVSFLYLSRYVVLTDEVSAKKLMKDCLHLLENLCSLEKPTSFSIRKDDLPFKLKFIENNEYKIRFTIKESFVWEKTILGEREIDCARFGLCIHSLRNAETANNIVEPFDFNDPNKGWCEYVFPHEIWYRLLDAAYKAKQQ